MNFAFLCHARADEDAAGEIARWLERNSPCEIRLAECGDGAAHDLVEAAEQALSADAVILLLSPSSVPRPWPPRSRWEPVLLQQPAEAGSGLCAVLLSECKFPDLLRRRDFFDASLAGRRALKRWLLARYPQVTSLPDGSPDVAAEDVEALRRRLADEPGVAGDVPEETARAFAHRCHADFEGVFWIDGARRTPAGICGDLAEAAGLRLHGTASENAERLRQFFSARRTLVVFDNCAAPPFEAEGKCSVVRTAPHSAPPPLPFDPVAGLFASWTRDPEACLAALRDVPDAIASREWSEARAIGYAAVALLRLRERAAELLELVNFLLPLAEAANDESAIRHFDWERSWILQAWGRAEVIEAPVLPPAPGDQLALPFSA